jgi:hypothetical protein
MVDISGENLLHELNRVQKRKDLFPFLTIVELVLVIRVVTLAPTSWVWPLVLLAAICVAVFARNLDVNKGTVVLNYSFDGDAGQETAKLRNAFQQFMACQAVWHVDASAMTSDWKRNAGANTLTRRSYTRPLYSRPPKVQCNIDVPTLQAGRRSLYFFPDRLLVYDSSGVGAVSYTDLHTQVTQTRFVESEAVPSDSQVVGSTWRFVAKSGGPDRRFNNNRQIPVVVYGEISLRSASGLNELFQYSVPLAASPLVSTLSEIAAASKINMQRPTYDSEVLSTLPSHSSGRVEGAILWGALVPMLGLILLLPWPNFTNSPDDEMRAQREQQQLKEDQARKLFIQRLTQELLTNHSNVTFTATTEVLTLQFTNEGPKAAKRDGINPFDKPTLFKRFLTSSNEIDLCGLGFRSLGIVKNNTPSKQYSLNCKPTP